MGYSDSGSGCDSDSDNGGGSGGRSDNLMWHINIPCTHSRTAAQHTTTMKIL